MSNFPDTAFSSTVTMVWLRRIALNSLGVMAENLADCITRKHDSFGEETCKGSSPKSDDSLAVETNSVSILTFCRCCATFI